MWPSSVFAYVVLEWVNQGHLHFHLISTLPSCSAIIYQEDKWECWFCPRSCALYTCLFIKYSDCFSGRQKVLAGAGNPSKPTLFPSNSNSRNAKPVNSGDYSEGITLLTMERVWISKGQAPTYVWDWFTQAHKSSKWGKLEVEVRNATCAMTHGAVLKDHLTEWFLVPAQLSRIGNWVNQGHWTHAYKHCRLLTITPWWLWSYWTRLLARFSDLILHLQSNVLAYCELRLHSLGAAINAASSWNPRWRSRLWGRLPKIPSAWTLLPPTV